MNAFALLFPGQGSQEPGMGRDLAEADRAAMDAWKTAERVSGLPLRDIYWDGDETAMADTRSLQPALTVVNLNLWRRLAGAAPGGRPPLAAAGHSLGEYSALAAAGVLPEGTVLQLAALRGRLMSEADPEGKGAMAAVLKLALPDVEEVVRGVAASTGEMLLIANYNTPGQIVISGTRAAIAAAQEAVRSRKGRALVLPVSGAFHSPLMQEASAELEQAIRGLGKGVWNHARFPVFCNASPRPTSDCAQIRDLLVRQMTSPVHWIDTIAGLWDLGARTFLECGPKGVLAKMVAPILDARAPGLQAEVLSVGSLAQADALAL